MEILQAEDQRHPLGDGFECVAELPQHSLPGDSGGPPETVETLGLHQRG